MAVPQRRYLINLAPVFLSIFVTKHSNMMPKFVIKLINSLFMPSINENYVYRNLEPAVSIHGISIGESSLSFRHYDPLEEYQTPLKDSHSTDNHVKYDDIAMINERNSYWEVLLWNGYSYSLPKDGSRIMLINTHRDVRNMSYFALKRPVTPSEIARNM